MTDRTLFRLQDIVDSIDRIDGLLAGSNFADIHGDAVKRAAFERFLEILSEASPHVPATLKAEEPGIPWRRIGDIGNHLRHAYHRVDAEILWRIWADGDLGLLKAAVIRMIALRKRAQ